MNRFFSKAHWEQIALSGPLFVVLCFLVVMHTGGSSAPARARSRAPAAAVPAELGVASYYGLKYQGRPTASGEIFDLNQLTAAHPRHAFGTKVRVTNLANHRSVIVRINDRGPFVEGRIIDLSQAAAQALQMIQSGVADVKVEVVQLVALRPARAGAH